MRDWKENDVLLFMTRWAIPFLLLLTSVMLILIAVSAHTATHAPVFVPLNELVEKQLYPPEDSQTTVSEAGIEEQPLEEKIASETLQTTAIIEETVAVDSQLADEPPDEQAPSHASCQNGQKVNINEASNNELQQLTGIGPAKAKAIIDYRITNGRFSSIDQLQKVKGIGEKIYERLKESIVAC